MKEDTRELETFIFGFLATHINSVVRTIKMSSFRQLQSIFFYFGFRAVGCLGCFPHRVNTLGTICDWHSFFLDLSTYMEIQVLNHGADKRSLTFHTY